jgi:hypothetical protein
MFFADWLVYSGITLVFKFQRYRVVIQSENYKAWLTSNSDKQCYCYHNTGRVVPLKHWLLDGCYHWSTDYWTGGTTGTLTTERVAPLEHWLLDGWYHWSIDYWTAGTKSYHPSSSQCSSGTTSPVVNAPVVPAVPGGATGALTTGRVVRLEHCLLDGWYHWSTDYWTGGATGALTTGRVVRLEHCLLDGWYHWSTDYWTGGTTGALTTGRVVISIYLKDPISHI